MHEFFVDFGDEGAQRHVGAPPSDLTDHQPEVVANSGLHAMARQLACERVDTSANLIGQLLQPAIADLGAEELSGRARMRSKATVSVQPPALASSSMSTWSMVAAAVNSRS